MKKVIITGGSRGIGASCVRAFAENGDAVAFTYNNSAERAEILAAECGAKAFSGDVSSVRGARRAVYNAIEALGGVDILVNNAGISEFSVFQDISEEMWENMIETNLGGVYRSTQAALDMMINAKYGRIINIASMWGEVGASCETHYSASKGGVIALTKALAKELMPSGITVNCVSPGAIDTEMNAHLGSDVLAEIAAETPAGRLGTAKEVAAAVMFFASDGASFITGQVLGVSGGLVI